jgi:hypothetical protein
VQDDGGDSCTSISRLSYRRPDPADLESFQPKSEASWHAMNSDVEGAKLDALNLRHGAAKHLSSSSSPYSSVYHDHIT